MGRNINLSFDKYNLPKLKYLNGNNPLILYNFIKSMSHVQKMQLYSKPSFW